MADEHNKLLEVINLKKYFPVKRGVFSTSSENVMAVESLIKDYLHHGGAVIWVSHDPGQIQRVATRHYKIDGKQLAEEQS